MRDAMYHILIGNDAPAWATAAARALVGALITGLLSFFTIWTQTDDVKLLVSAFMVPTLTYLGTRFGIEGAVDARKERKGKQ